MSNDQTALESAETVETPTVESIIEELVTVAFGTDETITPYKVATIINGTFKITGTDKQIPPQMMYTYDKNGMIAKGFKGVKAYNREQVTAFVTKYTAKHIAK